MKHIIRLPAGVGLCGAELIRDFPRNYVMKSFGAIRTMREDELCPHCVRAFETETPSGQRTVEKVRNQYWSAHR